jgi:hypothetical protein
LILDIERRWKLDQECKLDRSEKIGVALLRKVRVRDTMHILLENCGAFFKTPVEGFKTLRGALEEVKKDMLAS